MSKVTANSSQKLPKVKRSVADEIKASNQFIAQLQEYKSKNWGIGLNGGDFRPDGFLTFFTQRQLPFDYYDVNFGVSIGSSEAYVSNTATLNNYINDLRECETKAVNGIIDSLQTYQAKYWAIGLNGDSLLPDDFNVFFAARSLPFEPFVRSTSGISIGQSSAYETNISTLRAYLGSLN